MPGTRESPTSKSARPGLFFENPPVMPRALKKTYTETYFQYATATFQFQGSWVHVYGSRNLHHGNFTVQLDGANQAVNGSASPDMPFTTPIFMSGPLTPGGHELIITNNDWKTLDIDSITWGCDLGSDNDTDASVEQNRVDDTDHAFTWFPSESWNKAASNLANVGDRTGQCVACRCILCIQIHVRSQYHLSNQRLCKLHIFRDAVAIYGTTGPHNSQYSVQRSDEPPRVYTATRNVPSSHVLLYFGDGFGPGNNTVTMVNQSPGIFQIDYAVVHAVSSPTETSSASPAPTDNVPILPAPDPPNTPLPAGAIAGIAIAAILFVSLIALLWFVLRRNKTLWMRLQRGYMVQSQFDTGTPPNGAVTPLPYSAPRNLRSKAAYFPVNDEESFEAPPLGRAVTSATMQSHLTASTLVADAGSYMTEIGHNRLSLKPLRLASRWGPGTPSSSQSHISGQPSNRPRSSTRPRSSSATHLLQGDSQPYDDPSASAIPGIEEVPEDQIDEVLREPIRRNHSHYQWQSALP
ncbi:hypothetical protein C8R43DRAFT_265795 [Mycena crocata]|nr:hypothetical protein C8R43DRAFT_265795 [Mycena crocata]